MDIIDIQSLRTTLIDLGVLITALAVYSRNRKLDGVLDFVMFSFLILLNGILMGFTSENLMWLNHLANITMLLSFAFCYSSINKLLIIKPNMVKIYALLVLYSLLVISYNVFDLTSVFRVLFSIFITCYISFSAIKLLVNNRQNVTSPASAYLTVIFSLLIISLGLRLLVFIFPDFVSNTINEVSIMVLSNLFLFLSFGLLLLIFEMINKKLTYISEKDYLAGINNRRGFFKQLRRQSNESCEPYILAIMDVDHFKHINDSYGHGAGDFVIKFISDTLGKYTSDNDIIGRFGGEEFCLLINDSNDDAYEKLENIRTFFEQQSAQYHTNDINFTVSFGCVKTHLIFEEILNKLMSFADLALYKAKNSGRNQIIYFDELAKHKG